MNKELVKKVIKAKKYEYDLIKEMLPNNLRNKVEELEKDALNLVKDAVIEVMKEESKEEKVKKAIKKVDVDFS